MREILSAHSDFVRHWVEVFERRFDPDPCAPVDNRLSTYADAARTRDEFRVPDWYAGLLDAITLTVGVHILRDLRHAVGVRG